MPRVSVIIPAHNAESHLPETLRSVWAQTYGDWEIVGVDDGSSDDTLSLFRAAGPRVRSLHNEAPRGPAAARNRALAHARGELMVFLDADDLLLPTYLERQVALLEGAVDRGRRVGIVACDALLLEEGAYAGRTYLGLIRAQRRPITLERVLEHNPIFVSALVPAQAGMEVGWFDEELFGTEDFGLWVKLLERGYEAILNPEPLAVYRRQRGSVSSNLVRQGANTLRVYELAFQRGALTKRQRRIASSAVRYNRALEAIAKARFAPDRKGVIGLVRLSPLVVWVAVTNPSRWAQWLMILLRGHVSVDRRLSRRSQPERGRVRR